MQLTLHKTFLARMGGGRLFDISLVPRPLVSGKVRYAQTVAAKHMIILYIYDCKYIMCSDILLMQAFTIKQYCIKHMRLMCVSGLQSNFVSFTVLMCKPRSLLSLSQEQCGG